MPRGGIATYIGRRADLYSFALPFSMAISQDLSGNKEASPQKKRREAYNAIARPQEPWALRRAGDTTPI